MFENDEISLGTLPRTDDVSWQDMDPNFVRRLHVEAAITFVIVCIGIGVLQMIFGIAFAGQSIDIALGWLWLIPPAIGVSMFVWPIVSVPKKGFALRDKDILYKTGVFWHTVTAVPFNRIQHVEKSSTPLDRKFELSTLQLFTAGGSGGDLKIHGLPADNAENLRTFILEKVGSIVEQH